MLNKNRIKLSHFTLAGSFQALLALYHSSNFHVLSTKKATQIEAMIFKEITKVSKRETYFFKYTKRKQWLEVILHCCKTVEVISFTHPKKKKKS